MSKHTPGPWKAIPVLDGFIIQAPFRMTDGSDVYTIATVWSSMPQYKANATLIAAAPAMLEALVNLLTPGKTNASEIEGARDLLASLGHDVRAARGEG
jgi:hypothetical protein